MTVDYAKVKRQLMAAFNQSGNYKRKKLSAQLGRAYELLGNGEALRAQRFLLNFEEIAKELGWEGGGAAFPRPFNKPYLERLFWQANKMAGRGGQPRRKGNKPATAAWWDR